MEHEWALNHLGSIWYHSENLQMSNILKISYDQFLGLDFSYSKTTLNQGGLLDLHKVCSTVITFRSYFTQKIPVCQGNLNQGCFEFERFQLRIKSNEEILIYLFVLPKKLQIVNQNSTFWYCPIKKTLPFELNHKCEKQRNNDKI